MEQIKHMIQNSSCGIKHKGPHNTNYSHGDNTWEKEYGPVKKPRLFIALCTLPALILTIVFMIVPMVNAIYLSFTSSTALSVGFNRKFVFLDNYRYMFQDKDFLQALFNTLKLMLVIPAVTIFLSLVFAFILTQGQLKEKSFYRTIFFFPSIVSKWRNGTDPAYDSEFLLWD